MKIKRDEIKLLLLTYLLCIALFTNLAILKDDMDKGAIYMGLIVCGLITATQILIRKFYPHGDKFLITFACILSVIGIAVLYRLDTDIAIKQLMYFAAGIVIFIALVVIIPDIRDFVKYKKVYLIATLIIMPLALFAHQEVYGATNWIRIGGFSIQPSEFGKITFAIYLAAALHDYEDKII